MKRFPKPKEALTVRNILGLVSTPQHQNPFLVVKNDIKLVPGRIYQGYAVERNPSEEWEAREHRGERRDLVLRKPNAPEIHTDGQTVNRATLNAAVVVGNIEARKPHQDKAKILLLNDDYNEYCRKHHIPNLGAGTGETGFYKIDDKEFPLIKIFKAIPEYEPKEQYAPEQVLRHEYYHAKLLQKAQDTGKINEYEKGYKLRDVDEEHDANRYAEEVRKESLKTIIHAALNPEDERKEQEEFKWNEQRYNSEKDGWKPGYYGSKEYLEKRKKEAEEEVKV